MKKLGAILIISLLFIIPLILQLATIKAQEETPPGLPSGIEDPEEYIEQARNKTLTKWDYLSKEWKNILLKNKIISAINHFLITDAAQLITKILFGTPYSLSGIFLLLVFVWIFFFFESSSLFNAYASDSSLLSLFVGFLFVFSLARLNAFFWIAKFIFWLIYFEKKWWWNLLFVVLLIIAILVVLYFGEDIKKWLKKLKEKKKIKKLEKSAKEAKETKKEVKKIKEEEEDEDTKTGRKFLKEFGKELRGEGEFETPEFDIPEFEKP